MTCFSYSKTVKNWTN